MLLIGEGFGLRSGIRSKNPSNPKPVLRTGSGEERSVGMDLCHFPFSSNCLKFTVTLPPL